MATHISHYQRLDRARSSLIGTNRNILLDQLSRRSDMRYMPRASRQENASLECLMYMTYIGSCHLKIETSTGC